MAQTEPIGHIGQPRQTNQMGQMGQVGPTDQMGQMGPTGQMGQMGQGNQMGVYGPQGQIMGPAAAGNGYGQMGQMPQAGMMPGMKSLSKQRATKLNGMNEYRNAQLNVDKRTAKDDSASAEPYMELESKARHKMPCIRWYRTSSS